MQASGHQPQTFKLPASCWGHRLHYNEPSGAGCSGPLPLGGWDMWDSNIVAVPALPTHPTGRGMQWEPITALGEPMVAPGATRSLNSSTCSPKRNTCWPRTMANTSSRAAGQCGASSPRAGSQCPRTAGATGQQLSPWHSNPTAVSPTLWFSQLSSLLLPQHLPRYDSKCVNCCENILSCVKHQEHSCPSCPDGNLPRSVYPNSNFILTSEFEILSPWFCWVL